MDVRTVPIAAGAALSAALNQAAEIAGGVVLCFVDIRLDPLEVGWLDELVGHALRAAVGVVGAKLLDAGNCIQDGGILLARGLPRAYERLDRRRMGYMCRARLIQGFSAVSAACLAVRASVFRQLGGFDAERFPRRYFDIDFCLRTREKGYRVVWTPFAELRAQGPPLLSADQRHETS